MADKKIIDVVSVSSLNDGDTIFVKSNNALCQLDKGQLLSTIGAAKAGWGYDGTMEYIINEAGTFEDDLNAILSTMTNTSARQFQFYDTKGLIDGKFIGTLWRYTSSYATLEAVNYRGEKALKCMYDGVWSPWEWINPPFTINTEYRLTKRFGNRVPVYAMWIDAGTLPASDSMTFTVAKSGDVIDQIIEIKGFGYKTDTATVTPITPFTNLSEEIVGHIKKTGNRTFSYYVASDLSGYTAKFYAEYTKK